MMDKFIIICRNNGEYSKIEKSLGNNPNLGLHNSDRLKNQILKKSPGHSYFTAGGETVLVIDNSNWVQGKELYNKFELIKQNFSEFISEIRGLLSWGPSYIYVSIHPNSSWNKTKIKIKLQEINNTLKDENASLTYHGTQNAAIADSNNIASVKKALKDFILPDIKAEINTNIEKALLQKKLLDELFNETDEINQGLFENIFLKKYTVDIGKILQEYRDSLDEVNKQFNELEKVLSNAK